MKCYFLLVICLFNFSSCIPKDVKEKLNVEMESAQKMLVDHEFKKAIAYIELHKIRNGQYPQTLRDLQFLSQMDSSFFNFISYHKVDTLYELDINYQIVSVLGNDDEASKPIDLKYPLEFWKGLGCIKSNAK